jgi:hypothetical protein
MPKGMGVLFTGSEGWVHVRRGAIDARPKSLLRHKIGPGGVHLYRSEDHKQNFIDCVRTRARTITPAAVAHRSIAVAHLGAIAIRLGRPIRWDPRTETFPGGDPAAERLLFRPMRGPWHL